MEVDEEASVHAKELCVIGAIRPHQRPNFTGSYWKMITEYSGTREDTSRFLVAQEEMICYVPRFNVIDVGSSI